MSCLHACQLSSVRGAASSPAPAWIYRPWRGPSCSVRSTAHLVRTLDAMLWKLADNVKYEEDCEVRGCGEGTGVSCVGLRRPPGRAARPAAASPGSSPCPKSPLCACSFSFGAAKFYFHIFCIFIILYFHLFIFLYLYIFYFFFYTESSELSSYMRPSRQKRASIPHGAAPCGDPAAAGLWERTAPGGMRGARRYRG